MNCDIHYSNCPYRMQTTHIDFESNGLQPKNITNQPIVVYHQAYVLDKSKTGVNWTIDRLL